MTKHQLLRMLPNHNFYGQVAIGKDAQGCEDGFLFPLVKADVRHWLKSLDDDFNIAAYASDGAVYIGINYTEFVVQYGRYDGTMGDLT